MECLRLRLDTRPATKHLRPLGGCLLVVFMGLSSVVRAQGPTIDSTRPLAAVIDDYVREGLHSNLALRAQSLEVERSVAALDEARARYFPEVGFAARYTRAEGGRTIELPLGQSLNPVYQTLNDLLVAQGQQPQFPVVQDETIAFMREREQDTRVTLRVPLLHENLRVNESLFRNGKITQDQVLRARAELLEVTQQSREAENAAAQSRSYLNFLLNRPLDTALENVEIGAEVAARTLALAELRSAALANRPELTELEHLTRASEAQVKVAKAQRWPTLSLGADGGTQGEEYEFGRGSNYATVSLLLNWTFFDGGARRAGVRQAAAEARRTATQLDELTQQVQLEVQQSLDRLNTSADSLATADARSDAARAAFRIASRKRDEGAISQVEFIDARSSLTGAELNLNVTRFQVLARQAELDFATAAGTLPLAGS